MFLTAPYMREGARDVLLRRDIPCGRTDFRRVECGWNSSHVTQGAWTLLVSGIVLLTIHKLAERTNRVSSLIRSTARVHP